MRKKNPARRVKNYGRKELNTKSYPIMGKRYTGAGLSILEMIVHTILLLQLDAGKMPLTRSS